MEKSELSYQKRKLPPFISPKIKLVQQILLYLVDRKVKCLDKSYAGNVTTVFMLLQLSHKEMNRERASDRKQILN